jgi:hypothetical protein
MTWSIALLIIWVEANVILIGDFNARTSDSNDFILHDALHDEVLRDLGALLFYGSDVQSKVRSNPDKVTNDLGNKLFSLYKSSGLSYPLGRDKDYTFLGLRAQVL